MYAWLRYICIILAALNAFPNHITTHLVSEYSLGTILAIADLARDHRGERTIRPGSVVAVADLRLIF